MQIDLSDKQSIKADSPRIETFEHRSNVKSERCWQPMKQFFGMIAIAGGMQID
jgi:hypothetical protein